MLNGERLLDNWSGGENLSELTYSELRVQVLNLYWTGEEWQQDGSPEAVANKLWDELHPGVRI